MPEINQQASVVLKTKDNVV